MSAGDFWDSLAGRLVDVAVWLEMLRVVGLWVCFLLLPVYVVALILWALNRFSGASESPAEPSVFRPVSPRERLETWAAIRIAKRSTTRHSRRHRSKTRAGKSRS